ncbi:MAG: putative signaling protein [Candidatus Eremiobacteraeota bacterium]|nr:putative signaling protein [Candidatus Eremiobacteraeota bacterium]
MELADFALERAPFGISLTSALPESYGRYVLTNPAYCAVTGYSMEQLKAVTFREIVHPDDLPALLEGLELLMSGAVVETDVEFRIRRRDGSKIWVRQHRTVIRDDAGEPLFHLTHTEDISERRVGDAVINAARTIAEDALRDSEARYRLLADRAADMIVCTRPDRTRSYVSPSSQRLLGFSPAELTDIDFANYLHPDDRKRVEAEYARFLLRGGSETHTYRLRHKNGNYVWVEAHWESTTDAALANGAAPDNGIVVSIVRDISERKEAESRIASMACHDALTGLPNRVLLRERLDEARAFVERGGSAAVLSVDLDNFKSVNDTFGHAVGDALLQGVAERLLRCVRQNDTVARLGGDEFVVVMLGLDNREEVARRGQSIVDLLSERYDVDGHQLFVSASVGVTTSPRDGIRPDQLLTNADVALYCAKSDGRQAYRLFEPSMAVNRQARLDAEGDLRGAIADESFAIFYQPIVSLTSNAIVGFEALARWRHPVRGLVYPNEFIPLAEDTGMIVRLGEWMLRGACRRAAEWPKAVRLSVNVSAIQFRGTKFVGIVRSALEESGLPAHRLDLEITESVLMQESDGALATLNELRSMGVGISLDDFGTGYSSLGYLRSFRFDRIKIDRSFVGDLLQRAESEAIVRAVVGIGNALGIATVAEGVETRGQLQRLRAHGCSEAQGFLISKPRPAEDIPVMLAAFAVPHSGIGTQAFA